MKNKAILISLSVLIVLAIYAPNIEQYFTNWDFQAYERALYSDKPVQTTWRLLTDFQGRLVGGYYAPLCSISLLWDKYLVGSDIPSARVTRSINLVIHCINGVLLFYLMRGVGASFTVCAVTMLIFLVHPMQVASILWEVQRKTVLGALFYFVSYLTYLRYRRSGSAGPYAICLVLFAASLLTKPAAVTLPLALFITEALIIAGWPQPGEAQEADEATRPVKQRPQPGGPGVDPLSPLLDWSFWARMVWRLGPFIIIALAYGLLTVGTEPTDGVDLPLLDRPFIAAAAIWFYIGKFLIPTDLVAIYSRWSPNVHSVWWWLPLAGLVGATFVVVRFRRSLGNAMLWGLGNFLVSILPVIGLLKFGYFRHSFVADHFMYIGLAGLACCVALALEKTAYGAPRLFRYAIPALALAYLAFFGAQTFFQTRMWENSVTLWTRTLAVTPLSWTAHHNLGSEMLRQGKMEAAEKHLLRSLEIRPENAQAHSDLGNLFATKGRTSEALTQYR